MSSEPDQEALERERTTLEARVEELEAGATRRDDRLDELGAGLQAVRGFLGGVDAVNEAVERRADAAVAAVERLEARLRADVTGDDRHVTGAERDGGGGTRPGDESRSGDARTADDGTLDRDDPETAFDDSNGEESHSASLRDRLRRRR